MRTRFIAVLTTVLLLSGLSVNAQVANQMPALTRGTSSKGDLNGDGKVGIVV